MPTDLTPDQLGVRLLSSIADELSIRYCQEAGVTSTSFEVAAHGEVYGYILQHAMEHGGGIPTHADISTLYEVELEDSGDLGSYVKLLRQTEVRRLAAAAIMREGEKMALDPVGSVQRLAGELSNLSRSLGSHTRWLDADAKDWIELYDATQAAIKSEGIQGLPTGLKCFDLTNQGFLKGWLIAIVGSLGVGKSWLDMHMAVKAYESGKRVLFISPEMTVDDQGKRFHAVLAGQRGEEFSSSGIAFGTADREKYAAFLSGLTVRREFCIIDAGETGGVFTYEGVCDLAREHRPDLVVVDGLHLLSSRSIKGRSGWEIIKDGSAMLKAVAQQLELVVIVASQADRSGTKHPTTPPKIHQLAYGLGLAQSADVLMSMSWSKNTEFERLFSILKVRGRPPIEGIRALRWEVERGVIEELLSEERSPDAF